MDFSHNSECVVHRYLNRLPESLVLNGYRGWLRGLAFKEYDSFNDVWNYYAASLGSQAGGLALKSLEGLVQCLCACASCPLRFLSNQCNHLCRDECLLLSIVAALQHGDEAALHTSVSPLFNREKEGQVLSAAGEYAFILKASNAVLLPVSAEVITDILNRSHRQYDQAPKVFHQITNTIH